MCLNYKIWTPIKARKQLEIPFSKDNFFSAEQMLKKLPQLLDLNEWGFEILWSLCYNINIKYLHGFHQIPWRPGMQIWSGHRLEKTVCRFWQNLVLSEGHSDSLWGILCAIVWSPFRKLQNLWWFHFSIIQFRFQKTKKKSLFIRYKIYYILNCWQLFESFVLRRYLPCSLTQWRY